jgi:hypothetical protein
LFKYPIPEDHHWPRRSHTDPMMLGPGQLGNIIGDPDQSQRMTCLQIMRRVLA